VLVFVAVVGAMAIATLVLWSDVASVLPDVGKDRQGEDPWEDPVGIEKVGVFQLARIPDCAAAPVERIELWDEDSTPYWQVAGPPTPMATFAVGVTPEGFSEVTPYEEPPADAVLRLIVVRSVKGVAGVRYQVDDLREGFAVVGIPASRYLVDDFQTGDVCGEEEGDDGSTTLPGETTTTDVPVTEVPGG
jgi:hypothetical protein